MKTYFTTPDMILHERRQKIILTGKILLSAMLIFSILFPDFLWNGDSVTVTDDKGNVVTEEMSGQEIYEGIYSTEELTFSFSWMD